MTDSSVHLDRTVDSVTSSLLEKIRLQDRQAWERLVDVYSPLVYWWCKRRGLKPADAADIGQEVFLAVARFVDGFQRETPQDTFRGWLRRITDNKINDRFRRTSGEAIAVGGSDARTEIEQIPFDAPPEVAQAEEVGILASQIIELVRGEFSEQDWQAFSQNVLENQAAAEVAQQLGITRNQVYLAKSRILRRLRDEFGDAFDGAFGS
ncbi:MAG: sigma-70 family RNA polymerase sigma factor [Pirellulaceae bacterium]